MSQAGTHIHEIEAEINVWFLPILSLYNCLAGFRGQCQTLKHCLTLMVMKCLCVEFGKPTSVFTELISIRNVMLLQESITIKVNNSKIQKQTWYFISYVLELFTWRQLRIAGAGETFFAITATHGYQLVVVLYTSFKHCLTRHLVPFYNQTVQNVR